MQIFEFLLKWLSEQLNESLQVKLHIQKGTLMQIMFRKQFKSFYSLLKKYRDTFPNEVNIY